MQKSDLSYLSPLSRKSERGHPYEKCLGGTMRAIRITDTERLTNEELKELSAEILIQRKLRSPYIAEV